MKRLLRSIIDFEGTIPQDALASNYQKLLGAKFDWSRADEDRIFRFVKSFFSQRLAMPSARTCFDFFEKAKDIEAIERLKDLASAPSYTHSNFSHLLQGLLEDQNRVKAIAALKETHEMITKGVTIDNVKHSGVRDALLYFTQKANQLIIPDNNARTRGNIREDAQTVWDEYQTAKLNKDRAWGRFTGINNIDRVCRGIKKGELWIHAGFAGELKTTVATNWCYNLVTRYRANVFYGSLEMKYEHIRRLLFVIHTANARFSQMGYRPLDYRKVRDGELTPEEEAFFQMVCRDFAENPEYCDFDTWAPDHDITIEDMRTEAEILHQQKELGMVVIDHGGLAEARKAKKNKDYTIEVNSVIRDAKKFALQFNHGEGIPVLLLFQLNRDGKDYADKNNGEYKMRSLSYANEAERSADVITTTYLNKDYRDRNITKFCCLKNRDNPIFDPFEASVDFVSRRIFNADPYAGSDGRGISVDDNKQLMDVMMTV
jgi:replicative DNA helicase